MLLSELFFMHSEMYAYCFLNVARAQADGYACTCVCARGGCPLECAVVSRYVSRELLLPKPKQRIHSQV